MAADARMAQARSRLSRAMREALEARDYLEVETPVAVVVAGQEPHLRPFETTFTPDPPIPPLGVQEARRLHLQTSPEYAMKRLLARPGFSRIYQLARVFRDGEISRSHNPEFTLLEFYAAPGDAAAIMGQLEEVLASCALALRGAPAAPTAPTAPPRAGHGRGLRGPLLDLTPPFERVTCREAFLRWAGFDPLPLDAEALAQAACAVGVRPGAGAGWDDVFTQLLLEKVEPCLGLERPTFLTEYPASQAALARLKPGDARVAERFELYAAGLELANGWSELVDAREQRRRLAAEQDERRRLGRAVFPLDEQFLAALDGLAALASAGGVAVGVDRVLMLLTGAASIAEVLHFPASAEYPHAPLAGQGAPA